MLITSIKNTLDELREVLLQLHADDYTIKRAILSNASIGEHSRHVIEMFQCLLSHYDVGEINYDQRQRNKRIETDANFAIEQLINIQNELALPDKTLTLPQLDGSIIETNFKRELLYNLEHCIHHQALIKVALKELSYVKVSANFGVAPSTITYRKTSQLS